MLRSNEPLGLPQGSVRAVMTLLLLGTVCVLCVLRQPVPEILQEAFLLAMGMYFTSRGGKLPAGIPVEDEEPK